MQGKIRMSFSIFDLFDDIHTIDVVDIGASPIDGLPPYQRLIELNKANVIGFEPNPWQYKELEKQTNEQLRFLPYAIGDGQEHELKIFLCAGMSSLLEPDMEILNHFHGFDEWVEIIDCIQLVTRKLDDIEEITGIDYLKIDVQGSELTIIQNASERLKETLVIHVEVQFVPFYKNQPLFAEIDQALRTAGFYLHRMSPPVSRTFKPILVENNIYAGLSQILWADAVYVRKFTTFSQLDPQQLLKIAAIAHELYGSFDLCALALNNFDIKKQTNRQSLYLNKMTGQE
jgi:FkbM family methyltransferase